MRAAFSVLLGAGCLASAFASPLISSPNFLPKDVKLDSKVSLCGPCLQLGDEGINTLLNYILNAGVVGGCGKVCAVFADSTATRIACNLVCDFVGIKEFINVLNHTDIDVFRYCEMLKVCPAGSDDAAVTLKSVTANPPSIAKGDTVDLDLAIDVVNATGVGEFRINVDGPVSGNVAQAFFLDKGLAQGQQTLGVKLQVQDDTSGDFPVIWSPGSYQATFHVCQGECGSKHPHSKDFGKISGNFTLTDSTGVVV